MRNSSISPVTTRRVNYFARFHALTQARLGNGSVLARDAHEIRATLKVGVGPRVVSTYYGYWMAFYDAACVHLALAKLDENEPQLPPEARQRLAQQDLERAWALLDEARNQRVQGYDFPERDPARTTARSAPVRSSVSKC